jgi:hypothetical protein
MKKVSIVLAALLMLPLIVSAEQTVVVVEIGTGTWCQYCPAAAMAADNLHHNSPEGSVAIIENHNGDSYAGPANWRNDYYSVTGYPTAIFQGKTRLIGGGTATAQYQATYETYRALEPPILVDLTHVYQGGYHGSGTMTATIVNVSQSTVSGTLHFVITESHIPQTWQGMTELNFVAREWLYGESVSIPAGETLTVDQPYTVGEGWYNFTEDLNNVEMTAFIQGESKDIYNACVIPMISPPEGEATGSEILNEDGMLHPGETVDFVITLLNNNNYTWENLVGTLSTEDSKVEIVDEEGTWDAIQAGAEGTNSADPFQLKLKAGNEDGYRPELSLDIGGSEPIEFQVFEPVGVNEKSGLNFAIDLPDLVNSNFVAAISTPSTAHADIILMDASGRKVADVYTGRLATGLNLVNISVDNLSSGTYFLKTKLGGNSAISRLVILK